MGITYHSLFDATFLLHVLPVKKCEDSKSSMAAHFHPRNAIQFFKIILQYSLEEGKLVPDKFVRRYGGGMPNPVFLKPPDGTQWEIRWTKYKSGEVWFEKGWDDVVRYYSLGHGHLVLFKYVGTRTCHFEVNIFDNSALEMDYPLHGNLQQVTDNSDSVEILCQKPPLQKVASRKLPLSSSVHPCKKIRAEEAQRTYNQQKMHSGDGNELKSINAEPKLIKLELEVSAETMGGSNFSTKKGPKSIAIKKRREKPLTCAEKDRALQRVNTFTSKNPYFKIVMQPAYIKSCLCVPAKFVKQYLKKKKEGTVLLRVSDGRTWRVECSGEERKQYKFRLRSGWSSFSKDNNLKVGDVCVFELTNTTDISFLVHVFGDFVNPYG
ncbi:B3 domain-containing transcription factor VRN1-like isoform X2 [Prosopis cineraria]|uniref:B3 domain-containing transcription factor VRN1-like isoform X2 n=1 Tax=Prosopis cineraria TaxID=364024 RepID=UPI0024100CBB|nr:B3 domain-containing transcription factor VRN1-like isoform X2 [Prosopis cineraria]